MTTAVNSFVCPYKGLRPFEEGDQKYFFGRTRDQKVVISSLYGSSLTVLYGASGVGKTSLLRAGVVPELERNHRVAVVVFRQWQTGDFQAVLRTHILQAAFAAVNKRLEDNSKPKLGEVGELVAAIDKKLEREHVRRLGMSSEMAPGEGLATSPSPEAPRLEQLSLGMFMTECARA
jgi:hypothetical protein